MSVWGTGSIPRYDSLFNAPLASVFGAGTAMIGGELLVSDGVRWIDSAGRARSQSAKSPHLIGYWPLSHQNTICARDVSGNGRHFVSVNGNMAGIKANGSGRLANASAATGRLIDNPSDPRFNLSQPGASWLITVVHNASASTGSLTIVGCGASTNGFYCGVIDNSGVTRLRTVVSGGTTKYSSNFSAPAGTDTHIALLKDGAAGRVYCYFNGVLDSGFDGGVGYAAYAPSAAQTAANTALAGYGANVTGSDLGNSGASAHTLGHLQIYLMPSGYTLPTMSTLIAAMAADYTKMLSAAELP